MEQEAAKGKGAFVQALWTRYAIHKLYFLVYNSWRRYGASKILTTWTRLARERCWTRWRMFWAEMARCIAVFQVPDSLSRFWPQHDALAGKETQCGHAFHLRLPPATLGCEQHVPLREHLDTSKGPLQAYCIEPLEKWENDHLKGA
ncbi:hypothetical protein TNCV_2431751 [Trichonephila clavipes]|nr:hypothetical protein TNCV_2431751 [Trichonephila clavipes]